MNTYVRKPKKYLALLLALIMALSMSMTAFASDIEGSTSDVVAMIGETGYTSLDDAVSAAESGDTIVVMQDCTLESGLNLNKTLTIQGSASVDPTITFENYGIALWSAGYLTFKDCDIVMNAIGTTPYTAEWCWATIITQGGSITLDNVDMTMDGEGAVRYDGTTTTVNAIYLSNGTDVYVKNGSTLIIKNYTEDALEWDGSGYVYEFVVEDSTFIADSNRAGITGSGNTTNGSTDVTFKNSTVKVINSTGNGSNGANYTITDSDVTYSYNGAHGLSTCDLQVTDSTITCEGNGMDGIVITSGDGDFINSTITITGTTGYSYWCGGLRLKNSSTTLDVDADTTLTIRDNNVSGIFMDSGSHLTIAEGANVLVTCNDTRKNVSTSTSSDTAKRGGGLNVRGTAVAVLSSTTQIYNNHAGVAGDDIYKEENATVTFYATEDDWVLDDCDDYIDGWYHDGYYIYTETTTDEETGETTSTTVTESDRWEAHALDSNTDDIEENYINLYEVETSATLESGTIYALKAAHGIDAESSEKDSEPGIEKKILVTTESTDEEGNTTTETTEVDSYSVNAGDTVTFQLTSNVPDYLLQYLGYEYAKGDDDSDEEDGENESTGNSDTDTDTDSNSGSTDTDTDTENGSSDEGETESGGESSENTAAAVSADDGIAVVDAVVKESSSYVITFHDVLDSAFTLNKTSFTVTIGGVELSSDYYTLVFSGDTDDDGNLIITDDCTFELSINLADLYRDGIIDEDDVEAAAAIVVTYTATLSSDATAGDYTNQAWVEYEGTTTDKPEVDVYVYGIKIYKIDEDGTTGEKDEDGNITYTYTYLEGATFTLYSDSSFGEDYIVATLTTNENGYLCFDGLAAGTYYLVETDAPDGYVGSTAAVTITLPEDDDSVTSYYYEAIINNAAIPSTGGMGTTILYIIGALLVLCAGIVLVTRRRMSGRDK